ncbi:MAG: hypothetical protein GTN69_06750 [Armatimonadetes bacterium]|nr:hypothetical protein [Armatimonadota bacterium]
MLIWVGGLPSDAGEVAGAAFFGVSGALFCVGGIGYIFGKEWARRLADGALLMWAVGLSADLGQKAAIILSNPVAREGLYGIYMAYCAFFLVCVVGVRLSLWTPRYLALFNSSLVKCPRLRLFLFLRMVAIIATVFLISFFWTTHGS